MTISTNIGPPPLPEGCPSFYDSADYHEAQKTTLEFPVIAGEVMSDFSWRFYEQHRPADYPSREECMCRIRESELERDREMAAWEERQSRRPWWRRLLARFGWIAMVDQR